MRGGLPQIVYGGTELETQRVTLDYVRTVIIPHMYGVKIQIAQIEAFTTFLPNIVKAP